MRNATLMFAARYRLGALLRTMFTGAMVALACVVALEVGPPQRHGSLAGIVVVKLRFPRGLYSAGEAHVDGV